MTSTRSELDSVLVTLQLTDSAFPSGAYTLSHGLEGFVQQRAIDRESVGSLLTGSLRHAVGPSDGTALALAHAGALDDDWDLVAAADARLHASRLAREPRLACVRIGRQLLPVLRTVVPSASLDRLADLVAARRAHGTQPVVTGVAYAGAGVPARHAVAAALFAYCATFAGAALRLRLVDHRQAQRLIRDAAPDVEAATESALRGRLADIGGCAPLLDVMCARHETAAAKLFAS